MPLRGLLAALAAGALAGLLQYGFLLHYSVPLADYVREAAGVAEEGEGYAYWAGAAASALTGGLLAAVYYPLVGLLRSRAEAALVLALSLNVAPALKWLPTPDGVSYAEPVAYREAVAMAFSMALLAALLLGRLYRKELYAAAAAAAILLLTPQFTPTEATARFQWALRALQALAVASWALFWTALVALESRLSAWRLRG